MRPALLAAAPLALIAAGTALHAQSLGDPLLSATISQSFVLDSNLELDDPRPGTSTYADTRLLLGFLTETQVQTFALSLDTGLRALWQADEDFDATFASPSTAGLDYGRQWASGALESFVSYRVRDVDSSSLVDLDGDSETPDDLREVNNDATERRLDAGFDLALATDSPSSYTLGFAGTQFDYSDETDDDDNTPRTTLSGTIGWQLQLTPVFAGTLSGLYSSFDADNASETEIRESEVEAGVLYTPSEVLELSFGAGYANYTREEDDAAGNRETVQDDSGFVLRTGIEYLFEDVTLTGNLRLTDAAPETRLSGDLRASYPLPSGRVTGRVFQRYGGSNDGNEIRVTGAAIGLDHEINSVSGLEFDVSLARQEDLDTDDPDTDRVNFTAAYNYALTEVVEASVGYRFRSRDEDPDSATSNSVFVEIGRTFETRP